MQSASPSKQRRPGRYPRRGLAAVVLTIGGLALVSSFRAPSELAILATTGSSEPAQATGGGSTSATALPSGQGGAGSGDPGSGDPGANGVAASRSPQVTSDPVRATRSPRALTGDTVRTRYGPVQVQVTLTGKQITDVQALQLPFDRSYSAEISQVVEPMLREEALRVQGGRMRLVSGATYTSRAYAQSLQSALDQAA